MQLWVLFAGRAPARHAMAELCLARGRMCGGGLALAARVVLAALLLVVLTTRAAYALLGTSTAVTSDINPSGLGQHVTFTATVTGATAPGGTVSFFDGATLLGTGSLSGISLSQSRATFTTTTTGTGSLPPGARSITAVYSGNGVYNTSTSPIYTQNVNVSATTTAINVDLNPINLGQLVTITADVSGCLVTPVGSIDFKNGTNLLGSGTIDNAGHAVFTSSSLLTGLLPLTAVFAGDSNCGASTSTVLNLRVNLIGATTTLVSSQNPSTYNQSVTLTATVSGLPLLTPSGTITFKEGATTLGTASLNGSGQATLTTSTLAVGTHSITAEYGGDLLYNAGTSSALSQIVNKAATTSAVGSSLNPSGYGQSVTFTATITSTAGTPTGTVTFKDGSTTLGTGTLNGSGQTTLATSALTVGGHTITVVYAGDSSFAGSTSPGLTQTVNAASSSTSLGASPSPSSYGQSVTFTATVTGGSGTPTGTVVFKDNGNVIGVVPVDGTGHAALPLSTLGAGSHSITAEYSGDSVYGPSTSAPFSQTVNKASTSGAVIGSPNPSTFGQSVTFTATITGTSTAPTGTVTFKDGATTLGTGSLNGSGVATFATSALSVASHSITAEYGGDSNYIASTSPASTQVVNMAATTTSLSPSFNPSAAGQSVTFTAIVAGPGGTPTGTVTFKDGAATLGTGSVDGSGNATYTTSSLTGGAHTITAVYGGDSSYNGSTSAPLTQTVSANSSSTSLAATPNPSVFGDPVVYTATVTGGAGTPTGTVTFKDGSTVLGTSPVNGAGQAVLSHSGLSGGTHTITAFYSGDSNYGGSASAPITQTVNPSSAVVVTLVPSVNPSAVGQSVTFLATVVGTGGTPTGLVTFKDGPTTLGTGTLDGLGQTSFTTNSLAAGSHTMRAFYAGDNNFAAANSAPVTQSINTYASSTALTSSHNPSSVGQLVTFTATVTGPGSPTGTVTFKEGATTLATRTLNGSGVATFATSALTLGSHSIIALYAGDSTFSASTSATLTQAVGIPLDSLRLRSFQITTTKMVAQASGFAIEGAVNSAIAEGFADDGELIRPNELGLRLNFGADERETTPPDTRGAFADILTREDELTGSIRPTQPPPLPPRSLAPPRHMKEWLVWAEVRNTGWSTTPQYGDVRGTQFHPLAGITYRMTPDFLVGLFGAAETLSFTSQSLSARLNGTGASIGAYAGWRLRPGIRVEASLARTSLNYEGSAGTAFASFPATRWFFAGGVTGTYALRTVDLEPSLRVYYLSEAEKGYTDTLGTAQPDRAFSTGRASAGLKATYNTQWRGTKVAPYAGLYADYYFTRDDAVASQAVGAVVANEMLQGWSARITSGISARMASGANVSLSGELGGLGSSSGFNVWSVRGRAAVPF